MKACTHGHESIPMQPPMHTLILPPHPHPKNHTRTCAQTHILMHARTHTHTHTQRTHPRWKKRNWNHSDELYSLTAAGRKESLNLLVQQVLKHLRGLCVFVFVVVFVLFFLGGGGRGARREARGDSTWFSGRWVSDRIMCSFFTAINTSADGT